MPPEQPLALWYQRPAGAWLEALPLGNGRLGAMVYGGVPTERIALNDDTLWSGGPKDCDNPGALKALPEIRRLIFAGKFAEAHELGKKMMGPYTQTYLPMGELVLDVRHPGDGEPAPGPRLSPRARPRPRRRDHAIQDRRRRLHAARSSSRIPTR